MPWAPLHTIVTKATPSLWVWAHVRSSGSRRALFGFRGDRAAPHRDNRGRRAPRRAVRRLLSALGVKRYFGLVLPAVAISFFSLGCGSTSATDANRAGAAGQALGLSPGVTVTSGTYVVTGPQAFQKTGTVTIGSSANVPVSLTQIPVGNGYRIEIDAVASDNETECEGDILFNVPANGSPLVSLTVPIHCAKMGTASVTGGFNICPVIDALEAIPSELRVGHSVTLQASAHDTDHGPSSLSYAWQVNGVTISGQTQPSLVYTCATAGTVTITAVASDGDPACNETLTATLTCSP